MNALADTKTEVPPPFMDSFEFVISQPHAFNSNKEIIIFIKAMQLKATLT